MSSSNKRELSCSPIESKLDGEGQKQKKMKRSELNTNVTRNIMDEAVLKLDNLKHSDPVLELCVDVTSTSEAPDISLSSGCGKQGSFLSKLIYPLPLSPFFSSCFRQKALYIRSNNPTDEDTSLHRRIKDIAQNYMFDLDVEQILSETSSDNVFLWLRDNQCRDSNKRHSCTDNTTTRNKDDHNNKNDDSSATTKALNSIEIPDPQTAYLLHKTSNHATYCRAPVELEQPLISYMLRDTGIGCGQYDPSSTKITTMGRGEVEVFVGTEGHLTDWHYDFQENFTLQLSGAKKWTLRQGNIRNPIRGMTPHYRTPQDVIENQLKAARLSNPHIQFEMKQENGFGHEVEVILRPGDVLYFPAGMWHKVETLEYGVSINISLMGINYANLVCTALEHILVKRDDWRETVCSSSSSPLSLSQNGQGKNHTYTTPTGNHQGHAHNGEHESLRNNAASSIVTHKMEGLLKSLPHIVQEFCNNCGAEGLIPPVLRYPPTFQIVSDILSEKEDGNESNSGEDSADDLNDKITINLDDNVVEGEEQSNSSHMESNASQDDLEVKQDNDDDDEEGDAIINLHSFQGPEDWTSKRPSLQHRLTKNPLAALTKMEDVKSSSASSKGDNADAFMYILNVCFAGNEVMESAVRVIIQDCPERHILRECYNVEANGGSITEIFTSSEDCIPPALFYYGYLSWVKFTR